jgi:subtilisin family serine protease
VNGVAGAPDADIDAPEAWSVSTGSPNVVVAVIDTGVDLAHPDLAANAWVNQGENCAGCAANGVDDDGNGYVDDLHGWDWVNGDNDPADDNGHGTHVAGTIAAAGNDAVGVAGVTWSTKVMALKFLSSAGTGTTADAISAILYANAKGVPILNTRGEATRSRRRSSTRSRKPMRGAVSSSPLPGTASRTRTSRPTTPPATRPRTWSP